MRRALATTLLVVLLAGCAAAAAGPPEVHWGIDECSHCHMILSESRFAAVARSAAGEETRFDDLGCALSWQLALRAETSADTWQIWVHDARGEGWLAADSAWFVHTGAHTPMGSGILAFADQPAARTAAGDGNRVQRWSALVSPVSSSN